MGNAQTFEIRTGSSLGQAETRFQVEARTTMLGPFYEIKTRQFEGIFALWCKHFSEMPQLTICYQARKIVYDSRTWANGYTTQNSQQDPGTPRGNEQQRRMLIERNTTV